MAEGPDIVDDAYKGSHRLTVDEYKEKYNSLPGVKESNLLLVSRGLNSVKSALLIISVIIVFCLAFFIIMGYTGVFKPVIVDNSTCISSNLSDLIIPGCPSNPACPICAPVFNCDANSLNYSYVGGDLLFNGIHYYFSQDLVYNFSYDPYGNILYADHTYYLNQLSNCSNVNATIS